MSTKTVRLNTTTDVVAYIAATTAQAIADKGVDGHELETVMHRMTSDRVLSQIRTAYLRRAQAGEHRPTAITKIGVGLITEYRTHYGI
jgi:tellurite resistance protein